MAKKSMKTAAAQGTSVFDTIATGYVPDVQAVQDTVDVQDVKGVQYERLNLRIPAYIKEYLYEAAFRESTAKKSVSVTEYLCELVRTDMEKHK